MKLDYRPKLWEDRIALYCAYLIHTGIQSSTLKSYISGIKYILKYIGYKWSDSQIELTSLTKACKIKNDVPRTRLPIHIKLLETLLFEVKRYYKNQPYLQCLYQAIFLLAYYGLFRIGELTYSKHQVKAKDVYIGVNKPKILIVLYLSKTHDKESRPQKVKISANHHHSSNMKKHHLFFCPFKYLNAYMAMRIEYANDSDPFFVFSDGSDVHPYHVRHVLSECLKRLNMNHTLYGTQSFRTGRASDMMKNGISIERIKLAGRWKSNVVYRYIKNI